MAPLPPSTTGQPKRWAMAVKSRGKTPERGAVSGSIEWAAVPATRARPSSVRNRLAMCWAELRPRSTERGGRQRMRGHRSHGAQEGGEDLVQVAHERREDARVGRSVGAERGGDLVDTRSHAHGAPAVEGMGEGDGRGQEPDAVGGEVDVGEGRGGEQERVHGRADVVAEPGQRQLGGAAAPARLVAPPRRRRPPGRPGPA